MNNPTLCPENIKKSLDDYVAHGIHPGDFLTAVLENDFINAFKTADNTNTLAMSDIAAYVYNELPCNCWGSYDKVRAWINLKRFEEDNATHTT